MRSLVSTLFTSSISLFLRIASVLLIRRWKALLDVVIGKLNIPPVKTVHSLVT